MANLKFYINPSTSTAMNDSAIDTYGTNEGYIAFDEVTKLLYVRGIGYGLSDENATALTNAVNDITTLKGNASTDGSVLHSIANVTGTLTGALAGMTGTDATATKTVAQLVTALQSEISNLSTTVSNNASAAVQRSTGTGATDYADTNAIHSAIEAVKATGSDTKDTASVAGAKLFATNEASNAQSSAIAAVVGDTTGKISTSTTELDDGTIWKLNEEQTLTHLKDLINTLGGTDLAAVQDAIRAIKAELMNDEGNEINELANSLIDKLAGFLNSKTSWTMGSGISGATTSSATNVETIISTLEGYINSVKTTADAAVSDVKVKIGTGTATTIVTNNIATLEVAEGTTNGTVKIAGSDVAVHGLGGAAYKADNYYDVAGTASGLINALDSTPSQTAAEGNGQLSLSLTQTDGKVTAISGSIAANTYDAYGAASTVQTTVVGSAGDASSASTINGAKKYADEVAASAASTAAGNVVSWTVIGAGS